MLKYPDMTQHTFASRSDLVAEPSQDGFRSNDCSALVLQSQQAQTDAVQLLILKISLVCDPLRSTTRFYGESEREALCLRWGELPYKMSITGLAGKIALGGRNPKSRWTSMTVPPSLVRFTGDRFSGCTPV